MLRTAAQQQRGDVVLHCKAVQDKESTVLDPHLTVSDLEGKAFDHMRKGQPPPQPMEQVDEGGEQEVQPPKTSTGADSSPQL